MTDDVHPVSQKRFHVTEDDLCDLERMLPQLCEFATLRPDARPMFRVMTRRLQQIMTNIRWDYGPSGEVHVIPVDGPMPNSED